MTTREKMKPALRAGILTIGNEVLDGHVLDTNSNWIEKQLASLSIPMIRLACVRDNLDEIASGLEFLTGECNVVITSGGLGPTHDDMTLKALGDALGLELAEDDEALSIVKRQYKMLSKKKIVASSELTEPRMKMAHIPVGSKALDNRIGGAPGVMIEQNGVHIFALPGVPGELKYIFENSVKPWLQENATEAFFERVVEFVWKDESEFAPIIDLVMKRYPDVYIKSMPRQYGTTKVLRVWVSSRGKSLKDLETVVQIAIDLLSAEAGQTPSIVEIEYK
ncbi:MAG: competence/damage-inducible protein A [Candidatus Thorarchaeota archaeon]